MGSEMCIRDRGSAEGLTDGDGIGGVVGLYEGRAEGLTDGDGIGEFVGL